MPHNAYILNAVRSPRGKGKKDQGALSGLHPQELLAQTLKHLASSSQLNPKHVDDLIVGCVSQVGEQGANLARNALLSADWPQEISAVTLNRFCGSGLQAVNFAAMGIMSGMQEVVIGGGVESMSRVPLGADGGGIDGNHLRLRLKTPQVPQGISADLIAKLYGFNRQDLDQFALESQQKATKALESGVFERSLFAVQDPETGAILLERDEYPRPDTQLEGLASLKPAFEKMGAMAVGPQGETLDHIALLKYPQAGTIPHVHTAGNSSGIVDGAAAVLLVSDRYLQQNGCKPRAKIRAMATHGSEPLIMLTGPAEVSQKALKQAGMSVADIDLWEINEAFAVVPLQTMQALNLSPEKVNIWGGAIALGHPLGATGAILLGTVLDALEAKGLGTALITLCIGGGQSIATIIERI
ncbi:acetyl-CoA acetyltransferase [bacterium (Candidatus Blackallbacteria) CG17_big_fil_post_rev_8_21_14_2_50_48_46]|uniref:Acetyl-CoA acetyltransferase n=1 Tax=bacterium (Candidatus Blackallbacteria) CG17_big_fil_post_rev_8_21_14_2_50_48_46 TaxID=2014261 RepID=A0A2M7G3M8_9BACT|nr:MAG: acetyl-CoA acetyltransferase [bacterium (Candidatus Blackallbacteria) CG18_big_fil_WC_8_21_14_2_50_49_26]PIW16480.1 MAG: acetyl-CoA acetyltransferase [bacterium (Candidatus Blackallbacteria) CG17_big_fil_post_rev_8_21_14_2_50_48_46]PIW45988.1 MAG: acetyl-CoA acetyltransferase [bacterium (Candidatus Blackallbacteria) CG13_big_fil_rev_8_21_14_2_50_49_14]